MLKVFVFNEVIVGAIIILQVVSALCCGKLGKSRHLNEIEGEGFGVDEDEVRRIREELRESRLRTESLRKDEARGGTDLRKIKDEIHEQEQPRIRSVSHNPQQQDNELKPGRKEGDSPISTQKKAGEVVR